MQTFKLQSLSDWHEIAPGETIAFPANGSRTVRLAITSNGPVEVWASDTKAEVLAACHAGSFAVEFTAEGDAALRFVADDGTAIFARGFAPDHRVAARDLPKFTTIAPRSRRNSDVDRMMMLMQHNERQREAAYQANMRRMETALQAAKAGTPPQTTPAPAPAPVAPAEGAA